MQREAGFFQKYLKRQKGHVRKGWARDTARRKRGSGERAAGAEADVRAKRTRAAFAFLSRDVLDHTALERF